MTNEHEDGLTAEQWSALLDRLPTPQILMTKNQSYRVERTAEAATRVVFAMPQGLRWFQRKGDTWFALQMSAQVLGKGMISIGTVDVEYMASYATSSKPVLSASDVEALCQVVKYMLYPYLREAVQSELTRMGVPAIVPPLIRGDRAPLAEYIVDVKPQSSRRLAGDARVD